MKKIKRMICIVISCILWVSLLGGCSKKKNEETKVDTVMTDYPKYSIQVIVPLGSGGDTDLCARLFATYLEKELGVSVVVNNIKGAAGVTGSREVLNAKPDGYTVLFYQYAALVNMVTGASDFSYIDDFEVAGIAMQDDCYIWLGNGKSDYNDLGDVIEDARKNPGKVNIALSGTGNMSHLSAAIIERLADVDFNLVDFGSATEDAAALLSNQVATYAGYYVSAKSYLESGDFKPLAVFAEQRHPLFPDVPTVKELGYEADCLNTKFYYYAFPKDTPKEVVSAFSTAMEKVCSDEEAQKKFYDDYYITLKYMNPEESIDYMRGVYEDFNKYSDIFK
ncbi:tripartite tricarboxylate transporter substrate binding protein [Clostridium sp. chh4-2]|uniref:tripartite tricarboxylate transporter substrate binding protein n=1 Tax=Clostridium sp. chh4-2 TaxID=2067550 RepID=UPI000CCDE7EF|nr:tripartite tricarboxylate transporter substrate binding protein [Clostridium sp. chh4-2]PNV62324.1 tripartite tricarboxylate transporter substrate binding protein [Clostridium sp. chh4-2]